MGFYQSLKSVGFLVILYERDYNSIHMIYLGTVHGIYLDFGIVTTSRS